MNTKFEQIINRHAIGHYEKIDFNEVHSLASQEELNDAKQDEEKVLFLGIDLQNDFLEEGALGVPGSHEDVHAITRFIYRNLYSITNIAVSLDTHAMKQIFHPSWWIDQKGNHPKPLTIITVADVEAGKWTPLYEHDKSIQYVKGLERQGLKQLCIWPFHCIEGTPGAALESQFSKLIHFHSIVRNTEVKKVVKGLDPLSEKYGIIEPEYSQDDQTDYGLLHYIGQFDKVIIAGEAESHCVFESVRQIAEHFATNDLTHNIYVLKDGMSCIPSFEEETEKGWKQLSDKYGVKLVESSELNL
ncbi:nicotinamidase-related amidase [Alkalibacillus filiformis]|uniref:Nicotinamidase-related amidase n=1 Tax=Alkalibacillus filiformis TaxID=200990 RepID=A0ABU0DUY5_9BACI|nr:hypothetical protein [Alkalibacillus filiformis]MDQ0352108.1 nicotinamidase-related amidase [Alkalibacillus filiformis]